MGIPPRRSNSSPLFACHFSLWLFSAIFCYSHELMAAEVVLFSPTGTVKGVQQATVRFSTDMVPMGDPRSEIDPFIVKCNVKAQMDNRNGYSTEEEAPSSSTRQGRAKTAVPRYRTRWADSKNWVLEFEKPLGAGITCQFQVNAGAKDLAGDGVHGEESYVFSTSGPAILGVAPAYGEIEAQQYFVAKIDGEVDESSVEKTAYFEVEGLPEKVGVKLKHAKDREAVIFAAIRDNWRWSDDIQDFDVEKLEKSAELSPAKHKLLEKFLVLSAVRRFPDGAQVVLHWPKGIKSKTGIPVEDPQNFGFRVMQPFSVAFYCTRVNANAPCSPILPMTLQFTNRVPLARLREAKLVMEGGKSWSPIELTQGDQNSNSVVGFESKLSPSFALIENFADATVGNLTFPGPFPEHAKFKVMLPKDLKDELGRPLVNQKKFPLDVATDNASPLLKFPASFGILELKGEPILPLSLRNVEKSASAKQLVMEGKSLRLSDGIRLAEIIRRYHAVIGKDFSYSSRGISLLKKDEGSKFVVNKPLAGQELELVGIPLAKPGFYVVEMDSPRLGSALLGGGPMFVATAALVTDLAVHMKLGRESSAVWVTQLSNAKPASGAKVALVDSKGKELAKGETDRDGLLRLGAFHRPCMENFAGDEEGAALESGDGEKSCEIFAFAQLGEDLSFASSYWTKGIEPYRFQVSREYLSQHWGPVVMHTVLNSMVAQPGETIEMKHFLREHHGNGFSFMSSKVLPKRVLVVHEATSKAFTLPFQFDASTGTALNQFKIPKEASLGRYAIYLSNKDKLPAKETEENDPMDWEARPTGYFTVSEYRLPLMKASIKIQGEPLVQPKVVQADLSAQYLSGGPAQGLKVRLRAAMQPGWFRPEVPNGESYNFFSEPMVSGIQATEVQQNRPEKFLTVQDLVLNKDGGVLAKLAGLPKVKGIQQLDVEMDYNDPNGEMRTAAAHTTLFPGELVIGLRGDDWLSRPGHTQVFGVITNAQGKIQAGKKYVVEAFQSKYLTHRKRLIGGFYSYDSKTEIIGLGKICEGKSDENGLFTCVSKSLPVGQVWLQARAADEQGRSTYASAGVYIYAAGNEAWWKPSDSDRIDLVPEKNRYEPGETAKILVECPFPESTVLVTVEREGVLEAFVKEVRRDEPTIEVPLKGNYAPNVFVSALAIRGRVGEPKPTALLDLARPAMKMGLVELKVGWKDHQLLVDVKTDKQRYQTRDHAKVAIHVQAANGEKLPENAEAVVVALDEALLQLQDNSSWDLLSAMMGQRGLAVATSSAQNQVVGRRHFGAKAKPAGGGGGLLRDDTRDRFEPMLLWSAKVKLNAAGDATADVPLNDSISSFRIAAIVSAAKGLFGHGQTTVESTKDLIIYSGFPKVVREGDLVAGTFTLRNTTATAMKVKVDASAVPAAVSLPSMGPVALGPSEAKTVTLPIVIPQDLHEMALKIQAQDQDSASKDSLQVKIRVDPALVPSVLQATLFQLEKTKDIPVQQPKDALPGKGGLEIQARRTLVAGLAGVKSYMEDYPFDCLEQKLSRAVVSENAAKIQEIAEELPKYLDGFGLLRYFPYGAYCGDMQLTRYVMNMIAMHKDVVIPQVTLDRMKEGLVGWLQGRPSCTSWWDSFVHHPYREEKKVQVMDTLSRYQAFDPAWLSTIKATPNLWKSETVASWIQLLLREQNIPDRVALLEKAKTILRSRVNFQGSLMNLQGDLDWEAAWQLMTSRDGEAMSVFEIFLSQDAWHEDVGRMARGVIARLRRGHWDTTMANAWGVTTLRRFSAKFEKMKVAGITGSEFLDEKKSVDWQAKPEGEHLSFPWPKKSLTQASSLRFRHDGTGKPWVHLEVKSALPLKGPLEMGYKIRRKWTPVQQATPGKWRRGDVVNVELTVVAAADQAWVALRDPIPAGTTFLGNGLQGSSALLDRAPPRRAADGEVQDWPLEFTEMSLTHYTAYAAYLPRGTYRASYRLRLNTEGKFKLPNSRVEAMYAPETFGEMPNGDWEILP